MGHSQGGHVALWITQLAETYTPGINMVGTAALAPSAHPFALGDTLTAGTAAPELTLFIAWVLVPYSETCADVTVAEHVATGGGQSCGRWRDGARPRRA